MQDKFPELKDSVRAIFPKIKEFRRHLHENPEVGFDTQKTESFIKQVLHEAAIEILPSDCGVLARIKGPDGASAAPIALRADIDALPLQEQNDVSYKSRNDGRMHACGHDGHTSMLLGASVILNSMKADLSRDIYLFFQPAEEGPAPGGALPMLESAKKHGYADKIGMAAALHLSTQYPAGEIYVNYGPSMASTDEMDITINGTGGHVGLPHRAVDALSLAAHFTVEMESFMSRRIDPFDPAVFGIGKLEAGSARNIIAERAELLVSVRCQSEENREFIISSAKKILTSLCDAAGASCSITVRKGLPVLKNDEATAKLIRDEALKIVPQDKVKVLTHSNMGAEDFAYFAKEFPAAFVWVGAANEAKGFTHLMHNPRFDFDEEAMATGTELLCRIALMKQ